MASQNTPGKSDQWSIPAFIQGWYSSADSPRQACRERPLHVSSDLRYSHADIILKQAFEAGRSEFSAELSKNEHDRRLVENQPSLDGLRQILGIAKTHYEAKATSKARKWLARFSSRVVFYGTVLDVLAQHHPEYVALAWGALKFLFMVCNHSN